MPFVSVPEAIRRKSASEGTLKIAGQTVTISQSPIVFFHRLTTVKRRSEARGVLKDFLDKDFLDYDTLTRSGSGRGKVFSSRFRNSVSGGHAGQRSRRSILGV